VPIVLNGNLSLPENSGPVQPVMGLLYPFAFLRRMKLEGNVERLGHSRNIHGLVGDPENKRDKFQVAV